MKFWINTLLLFYVTNYVGAVKRNNVCKTLGDYFFRDFSSNCWYNPDVTARASELITSHGYPMEIYEAVTEDFYILTIFRIPPKNKKSKGIVFLQHPLTASCTVWIDLGNQSLAFLLADQGYDVWLGNFRGNDYSEKHVYLSPKSNKYWNFSFHEMGLYDLPAQFQVVRRETGYREKIYYIGHSVATTAAYVYSSLKPQHAAENIKIFISYAPTAFMRYFASPVKLVLPFTSLFMALRELFHVMDVIPRNSIQHFLVEFFCSKISLSMPLCAGGIQSFSGNDWKYFDPSLLPIMVSQNLVGFSAKSVAHYSQIIVEGGRFKLYDYGTDLNEYYYHIKDPPSYPVENIQVPMYFFYGGRDTVADEKDVLNFYYNLPPKVRYGITKVDPYNHVDFVYAKNIVDFVYEPTLKVIEEVRAKDIKK